ncbi:hypothetical protein BX070DRAFT_222934 [Coemansia spiralis]|nr:hypothetical protein BX070DRAFT_222934 [Coemansia spiralis]
MHFRASPTWAMAPRTPNAIVNFIFLLFRETRSLIRYFLESGCLKKSFNLFMELGFENQFKDTQHPRSIVQGEEK